MEATATATQMDYDLERAINTKCSMLVKKVQDRKTAEIFEHNDEFITYDEVQELLELSEEQINHAEQDYKIVSILSTMKSLAHTTQSKTRWEQFTKNRGMEEEIYTFSSKGDFTKYDEIVLRLAGKKVPPHIVMCTHKVRIDNLLQIALEVEEINTQMKQPRLLRIYLDEFDKYIDTMREKINELVKLQCVQSIVIVTATPKKIWGTQPEWSRIMILNPRVLDVDNAYLMFKDCENKSTDELKLLDTTEINYVNFEQKEDRDLIEHQNKVLQNYPDILGPGKVIFAPGLVRRRSHQCVSQFWNHHNCAVFIFNGERTMEGFYGKLTLPNKTIIDIPHSQRNELQSDEMINYFKECNDSIDLNAQLNEIIADYYNLYELSKYTVVMTGLLCIERAQTLVHPVWGTFTDCIYYKAFNPDDKYQQQRQLGHIRNWKTFRGIPRVFAPEEFRKDVLILEKRAHSFAEKFHGVRATLEDYKNVSQGEKTSAEKREQKKEERNQTRAKIIVYEQPFKTIADVNKFLTEKLKYKVSIRPFYKDDTKTKGFEISTRLKSLNKKNKEELTAEDRLTEEKFRRLNKTQNISDGKGQPYMVYPVYPTMTSTPNEVRYYVSYLPTA